eukprot:TRINITY_DN61238_c0_g1_i1.p1 TRINITY_DN61238_c0_g1~~TRINITY_DN61238_c0_g1_i1.p1  ORF type:complete len:808 (+),score=175.63 TRINITY_DN61238_c0_g1_i1:111-2534(+)
MPALFHERYEKITLLGEGAFGAAYLVKSKAGRNVLQVAKEIRTSHLTDKQREGALAESEVLRMMEHPNIVAYIDSFLEGPRMYIVMEYADGGDLAAKIKDHKDKSAAFEEKDIMFVFVQIALALIHIHSRKVMHRDLKPLNIFLTKKGIVKLGDFGISRILDSSTAGAQTTIGTPHYLSPEIVNNEAYGIRSDLWSLGVVTYELAALRVPFAGTSLPAVAMKIMGADPDPLPSVYSSDLVWIVMGLLEKDPSKRPRLEAVQRMPYVQKYIKVLLSHSLVHGAGGCEAMTSGSSSGSKVERVERSRSRPLDAPRRQEDASVERYREKEAERETIARAEYFRTRQAASDAKRRAEQDIGEAVTAGRPAEPMQRGRVQQRPSEDSPPRGVSGKQREAEVRRRAQAARDEQDAARRDELNRAMREHAEEKRRLHERMAQQESGRGVEAEADLTMTVDAGGSPAHGSGGAAKAREAKRNEEEEYLRKLEQARIEQAEERRRLEEKIAARQAADDEVWSGSGEEVDSDKEAASVCLVPKCRRPPPAEEVPEHLPVEQVSKLSEGDEEVSEGAMVLEIPFTDKVRPKPKLSSEGRQPRRSPPPGATGRGGGRSGRPPAAPVRRPPLNQSPEPGDKSGRASSTRMPPRASVGSPPPRTRASGNPAKWLRSASCGGERSGHSERSSVLEPLAPTGERRRPVLDTYATPRAGHLPAQPPTPQGIGDVSQLQDALAHALCHVDGMRSDQGTIPEEILSATIVAQEVPTVLAGSSQATQMLVERGAAVAAGSCRRERPAEEDALADLTVLSDWKDTGGM